MRARWSKLCLIASLFAACQEDGAVQPASPSDTATADTAGDSAGDAMSDPGALIRTTATSRVGVLLDEVPAAMRDRVADELMKMPAELWQERARRQLELTQYRLTFRQYYFEESEGKGQLNLPPPSVWKITTDSAGPTRETIEGHDVVVVSYDYTSVIVSDVASVAGSEEALVPFGGTYDIEFTLPVDPELVLQRTGWACMDEAEFPPNAVDAESVATFYDDLCEVEDEPSKEGCHLHEPLPTESCVEALERAIGRVETTLHFERIAWDAAIADEFRVGEFVTTGAANVQPVGDALNVNRVVYRYVTPDSCEMLEGCVSGTGWRRLLRFEASLLNVGDTAMHIGDVDYFIEASDGSTTDLGQHGIYEYSQCHEHYHFQHYGDFGFSVAGKTTAGLKRAFCLETGTRAFNNEKTPIVSPYAACEYQGLTAGWGDEYGPSLDCQWMDITDIDTSKGPVEGELSFRANPDGFLCEGTPVVDEDGSWTFAPTDFKTRDGKPVDKPVCEYADKWDANNLEKRAVTVPETGGYVTQSCTRGQLGPLRDCGFSGGALTACTPGAEATYVCTAPGAKAPQVLRICEASELLGTGTACTYMDSLANSVIEGGEIEVTFTCPPVRDTVEPGGTIAIYGAPVWGGDSAATVVCEPK